MATIKIEAPEGYHWMDTAGGPALMVGDYTPHEGASAEYEFEVVESHDGSWAGREACEVGMRFTRRFLSGLVTKS